MNRWSTGRGRTARLLGSLFMLGAMLTACGTPASTPVGSSGVGAIATATNTLTPATPTPVATSVATPTLAASPTPYVATAPDVAMLSYFTSIGQIAKSEESLTREELGLIATGADDASIVSQIEADLPARQNLLQQLQALTPPDEFKTLQDNMVTAEQQQTDALQKFIQGKKTGDQSLIVAAEKLIVNNQMYQMYCSATDPQQALGNLLGLPTPEPGPTPTAPSFLAPLVNYTNAIKPIILDFANQEKTLCHLDPTTDSGKAAYYTQLKKILPALQADAQQLTAVVPPDHFKEAHQDYIEGVQKMIEAFQLSVQAYEQNDPQIAHQSCATSAQAELKLMDAQDALTSGMMNSISSP